MADDVKKSGPRTVIVPVAVIPLGRVGPCPACAPPAKAEGGPSKVATDGYRDGWDRIFGGKTVVGQA